ncbi:MAG: 4Fe-4S binding protein [Candidatus Bathyarchaeia archaeon]|jgi:pyruvate ferredoxin oxidoreductase delta subunit
MSTEDKGWKEVSLAGVCWKSSMEYKTGDWRSYKPVWDSEKCIRCMLCHIYCPEGAVKYDEEANIMVFDYDFCKGCGICTKECPVDAIDRVIEGKE